MMEPLIAVSRDKNASDAIFNMNYSKLLYRKLFPSEEEERLRKLLRTEVYECQPDCIVEGRLFELIETLNKLHPSEKRNPIGIELNNEISRLQLYLSTQ